MTTDTSDGDKWVIILSSEQGGMRFYTFQGDIEDAKTKARALRMDEGWGSWEIVSLREWFLYRLISS